MNHVYERGKGEIMPDCEQAKCGMLAIEEIRRTPNGKYSRTLFNWLLSHEIIQESHSKRHADFVLDACFGFYAA
jgi:hypothetical protein